MPSLSAPAKDVAFGELKGKTMLVVGLGGIGTEIARRAHGLGMRVIATRNSSRSGPEFVEYVGLSDELLKAVVGRSLSQWKICAVMWRESRC